MICSNYHREIASVDQAVSKQETEINGARSVQVRILTIICNVIYYFIYLKCFLFINF